MAQSQPLPEGTDMLIRAIAQRLAAQASRSCTAAREGALNSYLSTYDKPTSSATIEENSFYDKYKDKLLRLKKEKPAAYEDVVDNLYHKKDQEPKDETGKADVKSGKMADMMKASRDLQPRGPSGSKPSLSSNLKRPSLDSIMKLELLQDKTAVQITELWNKYHAGKDCLFSVIPIAKYGRLAQKGAENPLFIYAIPRGEGFEFFIGQYSSNDWYYTSLLAYQTHQEYAPYSLCVRYYTELASNKGIVLLKGELDSDSMKIDVAALLVHQTQLFYGSDENYDLVKTMSREPSKFKHMDVVTVCQKAGLF